MIVDKRRCTMCQGICPKCKQPVEVGEVCIAIKNGEHYRFFHIGCHEKAYRHENRNYKDIPQYIITLD
jgi:hypothetical protein